LGGIDLPSFLGCFMQKKNSARQVSNRSYFRNNNQNFPGHNERDSYSPLYEAEERPITRREIDRRYKEMYHQIQRHDERALARVQDPRSIFYAGIDPRRRQEVAEAGMIQEDENALANLSPVPIHREYSREGFYTTPYLDDLGWGPTKEGY